MTQETSQQSAQKSIVNTELTSKTIGKLLTASDWDGKTIGAVLAEITPINDDKKLKGDKFEELTQVVISVKQPELRVLTKLQQQAHDIMVCGTGKAFTSLRIAEAVANI